MHSCPFPEIGGEKLQKYNLREGLSAVV